MLCPRAWCLLYMSSMYTPCRNTYIACIPYLSHPSSIHAQHYVPRNVAGMSCNAAKNANPNYTDELASLGDGVSISMGSEQC